MTDEITDDIITRLINSESEISILITLIKEYPNDQGLGEKVRENFKYYLEKEE